MKHLILDEHISCCNNSHERGMGRSWYTDVLFCDGEYIILEYCGCQMGYSWNTSDFMMYTVAKITGGNHKPFRDVDKSIHLTDELKELRLRGVKVREYVEEVNYIYEDNARKEYCVSTRKPFLDRLVDNDAINNDEEKVKKYINENWSGRKGERQFLLSQVQRLSMWNYYRVDEREIVKTIEHLRLTIKRRTNEKHKH